MYDTQFLFHAETIQKYTTGDCKYFATRLAQVLGGTVIGIGSDVYENYFRFEVTGEGELEGMVYTNPMHYMVERGGKYIDITGVFISLSGALEHYNTFYKFALPDIAPKINMRLWTEPKKIIPSSEEVCDVDAVAESARTVNILLSHIKLVKHADPHYSVRFVIPYDDVTNADFCRAAKIVLNAEIFQYPSGHHFARIGACCIDAGGIISQGHIPTGYKQIELTGSPDIAVWSVATIKRELIFGKNAFLSEWYYRPLFPQESIAYLYLPQFMLDKATYPFKGSLLEAPFSKDVKQYLQEDDLYSAISEYVGYSDFDGYIYDTYKLVATLSDLWYNVVSKEPFRGVFVALNDVTDSTLKYIQKVMRIDAQLPRLDEEKDLIILDSDGYKAYRPEYGHYTIDDDWSFVLTNIIAEKLNGLPNVVSSYVTEKNRDIWYKLIPYPVDLSGIDLKYFLGLVNYFHSILSNINRYCKFFYGYRQGKLISDEEKYYLFNFSESIFSDHQIDISHQRENGLAKELMDVYGIDVFEPGKESKYIDFDILCFFHASKNYYHNPEIKQRCEVEIKHILSSL